MNDDYTPNLNKARAYYSAGRMDEEFVTVEEAMAEFDRFIERFEASVRREAA